MRADARRRPGRWALAAALAALAVAGLSEAAEGPSRPPAYHLESGTYVRDRVVVFGRDFVLAGEAYGDAVVLDGNATIEGRVGGDLVVLGGGVTLASTALVEGDVFVVGGVVEASSGARIEGRSVAYPDANAAWLSLVEGPVVGQSSLAPVVVGSKLALLAFWAIMVLVLFQLGGRELLATSESIRAEPFRSFFVGLTGVLAMLMTALFFSALAGAVVGLPLLALVVVVALGLRFWGMVAVFHALGEGLCGWLGIRRRSALHVACYGLMLLGLLKLLPYLGIWTWTVATFIGVGASLTTKLGRREPWLQPVPIR